MIRVIQRTAIILFLAIIAKVASGQITYVDLSLNQYNFEDCFSSIEPKFEKENIKIFPNPTDGLFTISLDKVVFNSKLKIVICNIYGQEIYLEKLIIANNEYKKHIDISMYPAGTYFLHISSKKNSYRANVILK